MKSAEHRPARFDLKLGVVSHVPHWQEGNGPAWAYEPYVREMAVWARLFSRVTICAPVAEWPQRGHQAQYDAANLEWMPVHFSNWPSPARHVKRVSQLRAVRRALAALVAASDVVLLRSPAVISMIGRSIALREGARTITKWAGPFRSFPGEALETRLERRQVGRVRAPALVYGHTDLPQAISFIPALMTGAEIEHAAALSDAKRWTPPWQIVALGRLSAEKGFELALRGLGVLARARPDLAWRFTLIGDGFQASALRALAGQLGVADRLHMTGALPFADVQRHLAGAHVVVMPGSVEGWPKTIAEAWAHRAVPVAVSAGIVPELVGMDRGVAFDPTPAALGSSLAQLLSNVDLMRTIAAHGPERCRALSLEAFEMRLERILVDAVGLA